MAKEGRRKWLNRGVKAERTAERVVDLPMNLLGRGQPVSDSAKRALYEKGVAAVATVLKAPSKHRVSRTEKENVGRTSSISSISSSRPQTSPEAGR